MALFIVIHHPAAPDMPYSNEWEGGLLRTITAPAAVVKRLTQAQFDGERVYVHQCGYADHPPLVCSSGMVASIKPLSRREGWIEFKDLRSESLAPSVQPRIGQNKYEDDTPVIEGSSL